MRRTIHRLAGAGFGAALAILFSVDVEAAPVNVSRAPAEVSSFDGLVTQAATSVRVRRRGHRTPRQMIHRHRRVPVHRERTLTHRAQ